MSKPSPLAAICHPNASLKGVYPGRRNCNLTWSNKSIASFINNPIRSAAIRLDRRVRAESDRRLNGGNGEGFRAPALLRTVAQAPGPALESLPRRKPRGGWGLFFERDYGDLRIADGWRAGRRRPSMLGVFVGSGDGGRFRWRRCAGAKRSHRSKEDWRPRADIALLFRGAAGGGGDRRCEAGCVATVMRCRS